MILDTIEPPTWPWNDPHDPTLDAWAAVLAAFDVDPDTVAGDSPTPPKVVIDDSGHAALHVDITTSDGRTDRVVYLASARALCDAVQAA